MNKRIIRNQRIPLLVLLLIMMTVFICSCGADTSAGDQGISQTANTKEQKKTKNTESYDAAEFLESLPEWSGYAFCYVNGNCPDFEPDEIWTRTRESIDPLDELGRCGTANSCIGTDGMPTEPRGDISEIRPSGWHSDRYDFVEGEALYNRCHLIAHMLSGDDAVPKNLVTGTSYMNRDGMLPFEIAIADYVRDTGNHVMYRVTPVFKDDELVCRGVHMEAISVEDEGEGLAFNVFCYNVQPGIYINYKTGDNRLSEDTEMLDNYLAGKYTVRANTLGSVPSGESGTAVSEEADGSYDEDREGASEQDEHKMTYVLNTNTGKFHYPDCRSVMDMNDRNKQEIEATREDLIGRGFTPCGNCNP